MKKHAGYITKKRDYLSYIELIERSTSCKACYGSGKKRLRPREQEPERCDECKGLGYLPDDPRELK